jgi:hypothetical protein
MADTGSSRLTKYFSQADGAMLVKRSFRSDMYCPSVNTGMQETLLNDWSLDEAGGLRFLPLLMPITQAWFEPAHRAGSISFNFRLWLYTLEREPELIPHRMIARCSFVILAIIAVTSLLLHVASLVRSLTSNGCTRALAPALMAIISGYRTLLTPFLLSRRWHPTGKKS